MLGVHVHESCSTVCLFVCVCVCVCMTLGMHVDESAKVCRYVQNLY